MNTENLQLAQEIICEGIDAVSQYFIDHTHAIDFLNLFSLV